jgi:hypothetical protein
MEGVRARAFETFRARTRALYGTAYRAPFVSSFWSERCQHILEDAASKPTEEFLLWSNVVDQEEMPAFLLWYDNLKHSVSWPRWRKLTRKSRHSRPHDFSIDAGTAPVPVQHAYHLKLFEELSGRAFTDCDAIVEVGGGYGNFCRMLRMDGFRGPHFIIDLPPVRELQRLFLSLDGVPFTDTPKWSDGACLLTEVDIEEIVALLEGKRVAFVATWSLSETPMALRRRLFPSLHAYCYRYLIATQSFVWPSPSMIACGKGLEGEGIDNLSYFGTLANEASTDVRWVSLPVPHHTSSQYLFGARD